EPADFGPLRSEPALSIQEIDPPPAPMVSTSMDGKQIGCPQSTSHLSVTLSWPFSASEMSAEVPPMSRPMELSYPHNPAKYLLAMAPAAIPEAASLAAYLSAVAGVITPPPECRSRTSAS